MNKKKWLSSACLVLSATSLILSVSLLYHHTTLKNKITNKEKQSLEVETKKAANTINKKLSKVARITTSLASYLNSHTPDKTELENKIKTILEKHHDLFGIGISYEPFAFDPNVRLFAPSIIRVREESYLTKSKEKLELKQLEEFYDYTKPPVTKKDPETSWYLDPLKKGAIWNEPFFGTFSQSVLAGYSVPFWGPNNNKKRKPIGVVFFNYSINEIEKIVSSLNLAKDGYSFILSSKGNFVDHPIESHLKERKSIHELAKEFNNKKLALLGEQMIKGESGEVTMWDDTTQKKCWVFYKPITIANWSLASIYFIDEIFSKYTEQFRRNAILITLSFMLFLFFLILALGFLFSAHSKILWTCSIITSLLFVAEINTIWYLNTQEKNHRTKEEFPTIGISDVRNLLSLKKDTEEEIYIPTGIRITHLEFLDTNHITLIGNIWQKYYKDTTQKIAKKIFFPKGIFSEIKEIYNYKEENAQIIGWNFKCIIKQNLKYYQYPFDVKIFHLKIKHPDLNKNVILTPDFDSYTFLTPKTLPGIAKETHLPGWNFEESYYSFKNYPYQTNFGLKKLVGKEQQVLKYNIIAKRKFLYPLISYILPLLAIFTLLFLCLALSSPPHLYKFLGIISLLLFSTITLHIMMRKALPVTELIYLEFLYFIAYLIMILVSVVLVYSFNHKQEDIVCDHRIFKILYWPAIFGSFLLVTIAMFY